VFFLCVGIAMLIKNKKIRVRNVNFEGKRKR
jgi:hypothetical protein